MNKILRLVIFFTAFALYLMLLDGAKPSGSGNDTAHKPAGIGENKAAVISSSIK
jgi:hypothetical protein